MKVKFNVCAEENLTEDVDGLILHCPTGTVNKVVFVEHKILLAFSCR